MINRQRGNGLGHTGATVAKNIKNVRNSKQMTQAQLSEALAIVGRPIPTASIGKIEAGLRAVEVDDLMAIALALNVAPSRLLLPDASKPEEIVSVTGSRGSAALLWEWALGENSVFEEDERAFQSRSWPKWLSVQAEWHGVPGSEITLKMTRPGSDDLEAVNFIKSF